MDIEGTSRVRREYVVSCVHLMFMSHVRLDCKGKSLQIRPLCLSVMQELLFNSTTR